MLDREPDFEPILDKLGVLGKYQFFQMLLQTLGILVAPIPVLIGVFTGYEPRHVCNDVNMTQMRHEFDVPDNASLEASYDKCSITLTQNSTAGKISTYTLGCINGHNYSGLKSSSFVSEMDLVCDKVGLRELSQTLLMVGQGFGGFISLPLADRFGRKPILIVTCLGVTVFHVLIAFAPEIVSFTVFRFCIGLFQQGVILTSFTLFVEMMPTGHRALSSLVCGSLWTFSLLLLTLLAWLLQDYSWTRLQLAVVGTSAYVVLLPYFLAESPRWLACNNRQNKALEIFRRWCRCNGEDFGSIQELFRKKVTHRLLDTNERQQVDDQGQEAQLHMVKDSFLSIFKNKLLLLTSVILWFCWVTAGLTFFGLILTSTRLTESRFLNFLLPILAEWPSDLAAYFLLNRLKRKMTVTIFLVMAAVCLIASALLLIDTDKAAGMASKAFYLLGMFGTSAAFNCIFLYTSEVYPTNLRSASLGLASGWARFGAAIAPYSKFLMELGIYAPATLFGGMCFISSALLQILPETKQKGLPNTMEEIARIWHDDNRPCLCMASSKRVRSSSTEGARSTEL